MNAQEIFDKVAAHLMAQGERCKNERGICMYRGPGGKSCAVGVLLDDETASAWDESGKPLKTLAMAPGAPEWAYKNHTLLRDLQWLHDGVEPSRWRDALSRVAFQRGLKVYP